MIRKKFNKKLIFILLGSLGLVGCQKPTSAQRENFRPIVESGVNTIKGRGLIEIKVGGKKRRVLFQALVDKKNRMYLEVQQLGVLGMVYGYRDGQSVVVLPKEKKVVKTVSDFPLQVMHDSKVSAQMLFSILRYDFSALFSQARYVHSKKGYLVYEIAGEYNFLIEASSGQLQVLEFVNKDIQVVFGRLKQNMPFPAFIDIIEGNNTVRWVWKQMDTNTVIQDSWFNVEIPPHFSVEYKK